MMQRYAVSSGLSLALILAAVVASSIGATAQPASAQHPNDPLMPVGDAELGTFIELVRQSQSFRVASGLSEEWVRPRVEQWEKATGRRIEWVTQNFIGYLLDNDVLFYHSETPGEPAVGYALCYDDITVEHNVQIEAISLVRESAGGEEAWRVTTRQLEPMSFTFVSEIRIVHPLQQRIARFSADSKPLVEVVAELCAVAGAEFAIDAPMAAPVRVTCELTDRTVAECLHIVARAVNWQAQFSDSSGKVIEPKDHRVDFEIIVSTWTSREFLNDMRDAEITSPADAAGYLVFEMAERYQRTGRLIAMLQPRSRPR